MRRKKRFLYVCGCGENFKLRRLKEPKDIKGRCGRCKKKDDRNLIIGSWNDD